MKKERNSNDRSATSSMYCMVQGDDPLEVNFESELGDDEMPYDDLASFCQKLLKKYDLLKQEKDLVLKENKTLLMENEFLKKENVFLSSKLNVAFEGNNSLVNKIDSILK